MSGSCLTSKQKETSNKSAAGSKAAKSSGQRPGGAEMLTLRGDQISDDDRLNKFLASFTAATVGTRPYNTAA
jgi:hypothetical protein